MGPVDRSEEFKANNLPIQTIVRDRALADGALPARAFPFFGSSRTEGRSSETARPVVPCRSFFVKPHTRDRLVVSSSKCVSSRRRSRSETHGMCGKKKYCVRLHRARPWLRTGFVHHEELRGFRTSSLTIGWITTLWQGCRNCTPGVQTNLACA